jgi:hypothetical protein
VNHPLPPQPHTLALAEMRIIMARLFWNFDLQIDDNSHSFEADSRVYHLWHRPGLYMYLTPRLHGAYYVGWNRGDRRISTLSLRSMG